MKTYVLKKELKHKKKKRKKRKRKHPLNEKEHLQIINLRHIQIGKKKKLLQLDNEKQQDPI